MSSTNPSRYRSSSLLALFTSVICIACLAIVLSIDAGSRVSSQTGSLINENIPDLEGISALQRELNLRLNKLYVYYSTLQRPEGLISSTYKQTLEQDLNTFSVDLFDDSERIRLITSVIEFEEAIMDFDTEMKLGSDRDWDLLRAHLASSQAYADELAVQLADAAETIRIGAAHGAETTVKEISHLNIILWVFSGCVILISLYLLVMLRHRFQDQARLFSLAYCDSLTQLPNMARFESDWDEQSRSAPSREMALMLVNLDKMQMINASYGHEAGDKVILTVTQWLENWSKINNPKGRLYHFNAANWLIMMPYESESNCEAAAEEILSIANTPVQLSDIQLNVTVRVGATCYPHHGSERDTLLRNLDAALREATIAGGNCFKVYQDDMSFRSEQRLSLESALRHALKNDEFELYYQPKYSASEGRIIGAEALIRWNRDGELVMPGTFIPVIEQSSLVCPVGFWVLEKACTNWVEWFGDDPDPIPVAVNISAIQFQSPGFVNDVLRILERTGMVPEMLELEITEETASASEQEIVSTMQMLRQIGVRIAIDDFGSGYSSLSYLRSYPVDVLKIDRMFISQLTESEYDLNIVKMVTTLSHQLGFEVVAEGVETEDQRKMLEQLQCDTLQGFLFSKPVRSEDFLDLVTVATTPADNVTSLPRQRM